MDGGAEPVITSGWRGDLIGCLARVEAAIDFAEEDDRRQGMAGAAGGA